jgi:hypothetical protein
MAVIYTSLSQGRETQAIRALLTFSALLTPTANPPELKGLTPHPFDSN